MRRSQPVMRIKNTELYVHKDYKGRLQLCYYTAEL